MNQNKSISAGDLAKQNAQGSIDLIDVRTPMEFQEVHAAIARNIPLDQLDGSSLMKDREDTMNQALYVICKSGTRGAKAQQILTNAGFTDVVNVEGGTEAWVEQGLAVVRGKTVMSLERQVRIAAGFIVFSGSVVTLATGNVSFAGIPAFVGAGLMFAGITDTCGMGLLIAKMPWNQCKIDRAKTAADE